MEFAEIRVITRFSLQCVLIRMCIEIVYPQRKACVLSLHASTCLDFYLLVSPSRLSERESLLSQQVGKACKASSQQEPRACCWACRENSQTRPGLASSLPPHLAPRPVLIAGVGELPPTPQLTLLFGSILIFLSGSLEDTGSQHTMLGWYQTAQRMTPEG